ARFNKYRENLSDVFSQLHLNKNMDKPIEEVVNLAERYFEDAKYFRDKGEITTALISLSYCEGLLDGLRLLNHVNFRWKER
ncbi:MAG: DUF357 domain-containing protein, partial [Candidatus Bathyarchaeota archaeon]